MPTAEEIISGNFDRENIDELIKIRQIRQYFPLSKFAPYGMCVCLPLRLLISSV